MSNTIKKLLSSAIAVFLLVGVITSCKKGEDDPFLSLRSRKARITAEWKVVQMSSKKTAFEGILSNTITISYDGVTATITTVEVYDGNVTSSTYSDNYTHTYTFKEDGTYVNEILRGNTTDTEKGTWMFMNKNKDKGIKNKESILLSPTSTSGGEYTGVKGKVYLLTQLKNKEMKMEYAYSIFTNSSIYTDGESSEEAYVFERN